MRHFFMRALRTASARAQPSRRSVRECLSLAELSQFYSGQLQPSPALITDVLERAVALRGGAVLPWDLGSSPGPIALSPREEEAAFPYWSLRASLQASAGVASFRLKPREYERLLAALRDLGEDNVDLHDGLARGFLWDAALDSRGAGGGGSRGSGSGSGSGSKRPSSGEADARAGILRVYAEALYTGLFLPRVIGLAAARQASPVLPQEAPPTGPGEPAANPRFPVFSGGYSTASFLDRGVRDAWRGLEAEVGSSSAASTASNCSTVPFHSTLHNRLLASSPSPPLWLKTRFLQRSAAHLLELAMDSINSKLSQALAQSPLRGRALNVSLMAPLAEAAAVLAMESAHAQAAHSAAAAAGASTRPRPPHPALLKASAGMLRVLITCSVVSLPLIQIYEFWAADATARSAGLDIDTPYQPQTGGLYLSSSFSLYFGLGAILSSSSSSSSGSESDGGASERGDGKRKGLEAGFRPHAPRHALSAHALDWAPTLLAATAVWLEGALVMQKPTSRVGASATSALDSVGEALEALRLLAVALRMTYEGAEKTAHHLEKSWKAGVQWETQRRSTSSSALLAPQGLAPVLEEMDTVTVSPGIDLLAVAAVRDAAVFSGAAGGVGIGAGGAALHPKYAATLACLALAPRVLCLVTALHPLVVAAEGLGVARAPGSAVRSHGDGGSNNSGSGGGGGDSGGDGSGGGVGKGAGGSASEELARAMVGLLRACGRASATLSPLHPLLYYTRMAGGAGGEWGPPQSEEWLCAVSSGIETLRAGSGERALLLETLRSGSGRRPLWWEKLQRQLRAEALRVCVAGFGGSSSGSAGSAEKVGGGAVGAAPGEVFPFWRCPPAASSSRRDRVVAACKALGITPSLQRMPAGAAAGGALSHAAAQQVKEGMSRLPLQAVPRVSMAAGPRDLLAALGVDGMLEDKGGGMGAGEGPSAQTLLQAIEAAVCA